MPTLAKRSGDDAEARVARYLEGLGWRVLAHQVRVGRDELDLVAVDPDPPATLVIVEVRWRRSRDFGLPEETVDGRKRARLHRAGYALREAGQLPGASAATGERPVGVEASSGTEPNALALPRLPLRFDLIVVEPGNRLRHHRHGA